MAVRSKRVDKSVDQEALFREYLRQEFSASWAAMLASEVQFAAPDRKWRFDYAFPDAMIAIEVEGGVFTGGRHTRGAGFLKDCEKYNDAAARGWIVFRVTPDTLCTPETLRLLKRAAMTTGRAA